MNAAPADSGLISGPETWRDLSGLSREIGGVFRPQSRSELLEIVRSSQRDGVKLHAFSCGKNWGFGSRLPVEEKAFVLDLSALRSVRRLDLDHDFAEIEPGVTQDDLDDALRLSGASHYFNVTGAGRSTSVLGNALERGIGYFGSKKDDLLDLEVLLGNGEVVWSKGRPENPHHPGLGPDLTGAFLQSGWGIVIGARVRLRKKPPYMGAFLVQMQPLASFDSYFDPIARLAREGLIHSVPHIANRERMISTFGPYLPAQKIAEFAASAPEWSCLMPVGGTKRMVEALFELVQDWMGDAAKCRLIDAEACVAEPHLAPALDLALGRPNDFALPSVSYSALPGEPPCSGDLDAGRAGLVHVTPTCAARGSSVQELLHLIDQTREAFGLGRLPMTLNLVNSGTTAVILSVPFDRADPNAGKKAHAFAQELHRKCAEFGFAPYRLGLPDAEHLAAMPPTRRRLLQKMGAAMDPHEVLGASRYSAWWTDDFPQPTARVKQPRLHSAEVLK